MAEGKKSIVIYADWMKKFDALSDEEAGRLIKHFFMYVNDMNPVPIDRITELSFIDIEQTLKRDLKKWEQRAERSRNNGRNGGRPPANNNPEKPEETQQVILEPRKPDSDSVSDIIINNEKTRYESYMMQSLEDEIWKETFLIKRQLTSENFPFALKDYNIHLLQQAESKNSLRDYKKHFANWVTKVKQIKSSKNDT